MIFSWTSGDCKLAQLRQLRLLSTVSRPYASKQGPILRRRMTSSRPPQRAALGNQQHRSGALIPVASSPMQIGAVCTVSLIAALKTAPYMKRIRRRCPSP